jgi:hypothetical protein
MYESTLDEFAFPNGSYWVGSGVLSVVESE